MAYVYWGSLKANEKREFVRMTNFA